jgi:N-acetyl-anhydromuramyl-L-alanine amidase AmpD
MTDYAGATWAPNSNFFPDTGKKSFVILHGTAGGSSAQEIANYFVGTENTSNPVSSHYIVDQAGSVIQTVLEKDGAYGNGVVTNPNWQDNPNYYTISIEHVKSSTDNSDALTPAQKLASFVLIKDICTRNGIGMHDADDNTGITGHFAIDPVNRSRCPGNFPWQELWNFLGGNTMATTNIPTGWTDDGTTLTAPNGKTVIQGFRSYILANNWDPINVPLEEVEASNPVEEYYTQTPSGGTRQMFEYSELAWTSARGVYIVGVGNELLRCRADRDAAKAKVALLQAQVTQLQSQVSSLQAQVSTLQGDSVAQENASLKAKIAQAVKDLQ